MLCHVDRLLVNDVDRSFILDNNASAYVFTRDVDRVDSCFDLSVEIPFGFQTHNVYMITWSTFEREICDA